MTFCGIDPGALGCIAMKNGDSLKMFDIPKMMVRHKNGKVRHVVNGSMLGEILDVEPMKVVIEKQQPRPSDSSHTAFALGGSYWSLIAVCSAYGHSIQLVTPQEWKKSYGLIGAIKADSKRRAISIYPLHEKKLRAGRHDKSEAALLADLAERLDMAKQFVPTFGGVA